MRLSMQKLLAEMQDALDWTQRRPHLPLPQHCPLPTQSWSSSSSPGTNALCPLNMLQITLLPGKSVLFLCLISWHFSKESEGGSASSIRRAHHDMSQHPQGPGTLQHTGTHSLPPPQPTPCWTSLLPHMTSTGLCFWGAGGSCVCALLWSLEDMCSETGVPHGYMSRDEAGPATALWHNTHPCLTIMYSLLDWIWTWECTEQAHLTKNIHSGRQIYSYTYIDI